MKSGVSQITPAKDGKPVTIELTDAKTKEHKDTLEVKLVNVIKRGWVGWKFRLSSSISVNVI